MSPRSKAPIYQIKVTLRGSKPPIWRRVQVRSDITLGRLHRILQTVMPWEEAHLHQFIVEGEYYGPHAPDIGFVDIIDENSVMLAEIVTGERFRFLYEYDFGDSWEHFLLVEKILPPEEGVNYPICIKGRRACPPEDVGGIWGYYDFLEAIQDPNHPEHEDYMEWIGEDFGPNAFDLDAINEMLRILR